MTIYVDQSGKIEDTARPTILAFSNSKKGTLIFASKHKKLIQAMYRKENRPKVFILQVFSALLFILINKFSLKSKIFVDREYFGREYVILGYLNILCKKSKVKLPQVEFCLVGKSKNVHKLSNSAFRKRKADVIIDIEEVLALTDRLSR